MESTSSWTAEAGLQRPSPTQGKCTDSKRVPDVSHGPCLSGYFVLAFTKEKIENQKSRHRLSWTKPGLKGTYILYSKQEYIPGRQKIILSSFTYNMGKTDDVNYKFVNLCFILLKKTYVVHIYSLVGFYNSFYQYN